MGGSMIRRETLSSLFCGILFSLGLGLSGMTQPQKVIGFLDFFGNWDPSLTFVMFGAILVYSIGYQRVKAMTQPLFSSEFLIPANRQLDSSLLVGSALFGIGWGIAGFCPGPAMTSMMGMGHSSLIFVFSMLATLFAFEWWSSKKGRR